jgi:hypothetical protein
LNHAGVALLVMPMVLNHPLGCLSPDDTHWSLHQFVLNKRYIGSGGGWRSLLLPLTVLNHALMPMSSWHVLTPVVVLKALHDLANTSVSVEVPEVMLSDTVAASTRGFPEASRTW